MRCPLLLLVLFLGFHTVGQPLVHFGFVSHNEETAQWNANLFYMNNRAKLLQLADHFQASGVAWNMQSDWRYLDNVLTKETASVTASTGDKNILRWLHEDKGVEMDPHAHESQYLYPDVVALMDSIGLPESKVIGGSIHNDFNGMNVWMNLENGQYGSVFPDFFWQPDYLMGGGTPNHVNDLNYYGFWNPQDTDNYLVHDPSKHLRNIGTGCSIKIQDTSTVAYLMSQIHEAVNNVQSGVYPPDGFYFQTIFFEQAGLNDPVFLQMVMDVADSANVLVGTGLADWKTFKQAYTLWETDYDAQVVQWECGQVSTGAMSPTITSTFTVAPTLFTDRIHVLNANGNEHYALHDALGRMIWQGPLIVEQDLSRLPGGSYLLTVATATSSRTLRVVKE